MKYPRIVTLRMPYRHASRAVPESVDASPSVSRKSADGFRRTLLIPLALVLAALLGCESMFLMPPEYASVKVSITDDSGSAVPSASLKLYTNARIVAYGTTDSNGGYVFTDVPPGGYGVSVAKPAAYLDSGETAEAYADGLTIAARTTNPVQFILAACRGVIDATVTEVAGESTQGVNVLFYNATESLKLVPADANGTSSLVVGCGQHGVQVATLGYLSPQGTSPYIDGLLVHRNKRVSANLRVQSCFGFLRVTVLDGANAPVTAAGVLAYVPTGVLATALTDVEGHFTFSRVPCGTDVGILLSAPAGYRAVQGRGTSFVDGVRLSNNVTTDVTFHLSAP